jgi:hypothetical protein
MIDQLLIIGAGRAQWYSAGLRAGGSGVQVPVEAYPDFYATGSRDSFRGGKAAGA